MHLRCLILHCFGPQGYPKGYFGDGELVPHYEWVAITNGWATNSGNWDGGYYEWVGHQFWQLGFPPRLTTGMVAITNGWNPNSGNWDGSHYELLEHQIWQLGW